MSWLEITVIALGAWAALSLPFSFLLAAFIARGNPSGRRRP